MKSTWILIGVLTLSVSFCRICVGDPLDEDQKGLQGKWIPIQGMMGGQKSDVPKFEGVEKYCITFAGTNLTTQDQTGAFALDPTTNPKSMTCTLVKGARWGYRLDGDRLTIAFGTADQKALPDIEGKDGKYVVIYQRQKK